jgi:hypothetical protein
MAVTLGKNPVIMTAAGDTITGNWKVSTIRLVTDTDSGKTIVSDVAASRTIWESETINANSADESPEIGWIDGLYVQQIPIGGKLYVYYE